MKSFRNELKARLDGAKSRAKGSPTPNQIRSMKPGPELDCEVHIKWHPEDVIEWRWCEGPITDNQSQSTYWRTWPKEWHPGESSRAILQPCIERETGNEYQSWVPIPAHSTDGNATLALLVKMEEVFFVTLAIDADRSGSPNLGERKIDIEIYADSWEKMPHAVAIAAVLAK